jgi:[protein-PII] uridylyltransferase
MKNDNILKDVVKQFKEKLSQELFQIANISALTRKLTTFVDELLLNFFIQNGLDKNNNFCLLALGSYGRRELQLHSDIDLLLLTSENTSKEALNGAQQFIRNCWDAGLEVRHQITTVSSCAELASLDLSVISSLMDMYLICGKGALQEELKYQIHRFNMWSSHDFFYAKIKEQQRRYAKYSDTAYNLEPNVKYGPGGLRDLHTVLNIAKRHFNINHLAEGIHYGLITEKEFESLMFCQHFLWKVRFALHYLADKAEERLSFDYQVKLAEAFGYQDKPHSLAIEQFMKDYFKVTKRNRELNEMLLLWFEETIVYQLNEKITPLDDNFQLANNSIEVCHPKVFANHPLALFHLFLWIAKRPDIQGVRTHTIRLIRESLYLLSQELKNSIEATQLFMRIIQEAYDPYIALKKMNEYGVLAHYIDCFATVTGQMQYDLFHIYTVDQHTLFVIGNISRFKMSEYESQFPLCALILPTLAKPEILYLSALFHDIAKGRGGSHSELGAVEALQFANRHHINEEDTDLLVWLVQHHLIMSQTAQRKDIYDPKTINSFCRLLPKPHYLDYLYLLTVADICGTNPQLWNAWKDSLLKELYRAAKQLLQREKILLDDEVLITTKKQQAFDILMQGNMTATDTNQFISQIETLWMQFRGKYFLQESPEVIARHTKAILSTDTFPLILIMPHHSLGGTEVFIYMPHCDERFSIATSVLSNHHVTIQEATITTCDNQFDLDTYIILDEKNQALTDNEQCISIQKSLYTHLSNKTRPRVLKKRVSRLMSHFNILAKITCIEEPGSPYTHLFLITSDRQGLLATISRIFLSFNIHLHNAKIATAGERVEDVFYITNSMGLALFDAEKEALEKALVQELMVPTYYPLT